MLGEESGGRLASQLAWARNEGEKTTECELRAVSCSAQLRTYLFFRLLFINLYIRDSKDLHSSIPRSVLLVAALLLRSPDTQGHPLPCKHIIKALLNFGRSLDLGLLSDPLLKGLYLHRLIGAEGLEVSLLGQQTPLRMREGVE